MIANYSFVFAQVPPDLILRIEDFHHLPKSWNASPVPLETQQIGDRWIRENASAILEVPTLIIPLEKNYQLNPAHPDYGEIIIGAPPEFRFDERLKKAADKKKVSDKRYLISRVLKWL